MLIMIFGIAAPKIIPMADNLVLYQSNPRMIEPLTTQIEGDTSEIIDISKKSEDAPVPSLMAGELPKKVCGVLALEKVNQEIVPASLNCTYKFKKQVLTLKNGELSELLDLPSNSVDMDKLPPQEKVNRGLMVQNQQMVQHLPSVDKTTIIYDEVNNLTAKLEPMNMDGTSNNIRISRPQIAELVDDITINPTHKNIQLNKGNLRYSSQNKTTLKSLMSISNPASSGGMQVMSGGLPALIDVKIPDNTEFTAVSSDGVEVTVKLSGYFKINGIGVNASYSFMDGYDITLSTGVEAKIDAKFTASHGRVAIPLYGIDIPAGVANVSGGIYLIIDNNGDFSLAINAESRVGASASVYGGTFFGIPTSVNPGFSPEFKFEADVPSLPGNCSGTITVGPYLDLNVFGFDIVSANVGIGAGIDTKQVIIENNQLKFLDCNVYGCLIANASAFGEGICLADYRIPLYSFRTEDTGGYKLNFYEVDAYTHHVSGKLEFNNGKLEPVGVKNGSFYLTVKRHNKHDAFQKILIKTNEKGEFDADVNIKLLGRIIPQELYAGDEVTIADIYNPDKNAYKKTRDNPTFKIVNPTIPFKEPVLEYADFFNNTIKGHVAPAFKKNKITGIGKNIYFNGKINLVTTKILLGGTMKTFPPIQVQPKLGEFFIKQTDVSPHLVVQPILRYNDFVLVGNSRQTDTDLVGTRLVLNEKWVPIDPGPNNINNGPKYDYSCNELFYIKNMRDTKQLDTMGIYKPISFDAMGINNTFVYMSKVQVKEKKNFYRTVKPLKDDMYTTNTINFLAPQLGTDGKWQTSSAIAQISNGQKTSGTSLVETDFHYITTNKENIEHFLLTERTTRLERTTPEKGSENLKEINWGGMLGRVAVNIKGVQVVISDKNDIVPEEEDVSKGKPLSTIDDILINEKIWNRINPNPVDKAEINMYIPVVNQN